jgi:D-alanyl-D-alanine carboxypeptidase
MFGRTLFYVILLTMCLTAVGATKHNAAAPSTNPFTPRVRADIARAVEHERAVFGGRTPVPGVLVGVWDDAGHAYIHGFGYADLANRRPLTAADHFRIGSNTKTFVISVLLQLVDEGKLRLDDPLSRFNLGVTIPNAQNITIREVCQMRSGLFEAYDTPQINRMRIAPATKFDPRTLVEWAVRQKPYFAPGTSYRYSNTNYLILGLLIESITKHSVGDEIRRRLLVPFGLTNTSYPSTQAMPPPWAHGYALTRQRTWTDISGTIPVSLMGSAGEIISNMADMRKWVKLYVTGRTNSPATQRARLQCIETGTPKLSFGLGIGCSAGWLGYTGGLPGYNTATYYLRSNGITIIAWVELQRDTPFPGVANSVFRDIARIVTPAHVPY